MLKVNSNTKLITPPIYKITDVFDNINDGKDLRSGNAWGMIFNSTPEIMETINCSIYDMCELTNQFAPYEYGEVRVCHTVSHSPILSQPVDVSIFNIAKHLYHSDRHYRGTDQFLLIRIAMTSAAICEVSALVTKKSVATLLLENDGVQMKMSDEDFVMLFENIAKNNKTANCPTSLAYERIHKDLAYSCIPIKFDKSKLKEFFI